MKLNKTNIDLLGPHKTDFRSICIIGLQSEFPILGLSRPGILVVRGMDNYELKRLSSVGSPRQSFALLDVLLSDLALYKLDLRGM